MITDKQVYAAMALLDQRVEGGRCGEMVREMLEAADKAAWRTDDPDECVTEAIISGTYPNGSQWVESAYRRGPHWAGRRFERSTIYWRPMPPPPIPAPPESAS